MPSPLVWCYVPSPDLLSWESPYICEEECPSMADAHERARWLRSQYPGHLFAVTFARRPLPAR
jgi:hypothetical protein